MERIDESRARLLQVAYYVLGAYMEQEAKKFDQWQDETYGQLYGHAKHEFAEIRRSKDLTRQLHNCADLVGLSLILLSKVMDRANLKELSPDEP